MPTEHDDAPIGRGERSRDRPAEKTPCTKSSGPSECREVSAGAAVRPRTEPTRIVFTEDGPALVDGPVDLVTADDEVIHADRFLVAICLCKRSRTYPLCDTSHRRHRRGDHY